MEESWVNMNNTNKSYETSLNEMVATLVVPSDEPWTLQRNNSYDNDSAHKIKSALLDLKRDHPELFDGLSIGYQIIGDSKSSVAGEIIGMIINSGLIKQREDGKYIALIPDELVEGSEVTE